MLDAFNADQLICDLFDVLDGTTDYQYLQAVMGIQVNMQGRDDLIVVGMLVFSQLVRKITYISYCKLHFIG